ncbi:MAG: phosphate signaling complex protein PhoU [Lautropia sp.]
MTSEHTMKAFDIDIDHLRSNILKMGGLVERQLARAIDGVRLGDVGLMAEVLREEEVVNQLHVETDLLCNQVIAKRQPIAVDLREIIAILHMVNDLERVGDEAKKIVLKVRRLEGRSMPIAIDPVSAMASDACEMLRLALDAFVRHDTSIAEVLNRRDDRLDEQRDALTQQLLSCMAGNSGAVASCMDLIFVVQSIERVGDHAKNIAEYVVNVVEGVDRRHQDVGSERKQG